MDPCQKRRGVADDLHLAITFFKRYVEFFFRGVHGDHIREHVHEFGVDGQGFIVILQSRVELAHQLVQKTEPEIAGGVFGVYFDQGFKGRLGLFGFPLAQVGVSQDELGWIKTGRFGQDGFTLFLRQAEVLLPHVDFSQQ